jgi:hypothetical protein
VKTANSKQTQDYYVQNIKFKFSNSSPIAHPNGVITGVWSLQDHAAEDLAYWKWW